MASDEGSSTEIDDRHTVSAYQDQAVLICRLILPYGLRNINPLLRMAR